MLKINKKYILSIFILLVLYLLFARQIYLNKLKKSEFPKMISAIEVNLNSIGDPYRKVEKAIKDNDYIRAWLESPTKDSDDLISYLTVLASSYDLVHSSVVDDSSLTYYGTDKIIDLDINNVKRDGWYFDYRDSESAQNGASTFFIDKIYPKILTIFINIPISDENGKYIGVAGGGFYYKNFDSYLNQLERLYNVELFLINDSKLIYSNRNVNVADRYENLDQYKKITNGVFLDDTDDASLSYIKYLSTWDSYLIVRRSSNQIIKEVVLEIAHAVVFILLISIIILIINSHKIIKDRSKEKESKAAKEALFLNKKITSIVNKQINYYQNRQYLNAEIKELMLFEDQYIDLCYRIIDNKNINKNENFNITELINNLTLLELPGVLKADLKIDMRLLNEEISINTDKSKFSILFKTLIILLYFETHYKELIVYQEIDKKKNILNLIISEPDTAEIIYEADNIFKKLFSSINIQYQKVLNSTGYKKTEIIQLIF